MLSKLVVSCYTMITRSKRREDDSFIELTFPSKKRTEDIDILDRSLELTDPTPNIHRLFKSLDARYFAGLLSKNPVEVKWSTSVYLHHAGTCCTQKLVEKDGEKLLKIEIEMNERLLKLRTRRDLVETLLHEMIHAYLSIKNACDNHGPNFRMEMERINAATGANVTIHHYFDNEVALYENRLWRCNGRCRNRSPQFGFIRIIGHKAVDFEDQWWWSYHLKHCGGNFELMRPE